MSNRTPQSIERDLRAVVAELDPDAIPMCEVLEAWKMFNAIVHLAASAKTLLARRVEEGNTWRSAGFRSAAEQLAALAGTSVNTEKKSIETSKRVRKLPKTEAAMRRGKLSPAKVEAIASAATVAPAAEGDLLDGAEKASLSELLEKCLKAKAVDVDKARERIHRDRCARVYKDGEGAWNVYARGPNDVGAEFMTAWQPLIDAEFKLAKAEGREEPVVAYAFDALMKLAGLAAHPANPATATDTEPTGTEPIKEPKAKRTPAKYLALIRLDYEALVRGAIDGEETCEIAGLGPIPVRIARELLGDAILKLVITKGVDVANVTHLGRSPTMAQRVALWWRSPECTREGCTRTQRLENDHREGWAETKRTRVDELDPLCDHEHDLKTYHGWALVKGKGKRPMVPPDDPRHPNYRAPPEDRA
jgi:Domain of unknown function (DUF222)